MNEIVAFAVPNPVAVLTDAKTYSEFYKSIKDQIAAFEPDTSTETGRKKIASMAYKVTRSKTAIDDAGKKLNEEARAQINAVDAQRRKIREELESLAAEVRQPLTEWEDREDDRKTKASNDLTQIALLSLVRAEDGAAAIRERLSILRGMIISEDVHIDGTEHARTNLTEAVGKLEEALARIEKHEADQRELAKLREEAERREAVERAEKARREQEEADAKRKADAEAEQQRREQQAADRARIAAEMAAKAEQDRVEREAKEAVAKAEAEARAIREKAEREERDRQEAEAEIKRAQAAREADRAHRSKVMGEAKEAIIATGADEPTAKAIVLAIVAGEVPHVTLRF